MAEIAVEAGLTADDSALVGASKLFGYLWDSAWEHGRGTAAGDSDDLHDMRVALRRLRTAMASFEGPKTAPVLSLRLRREIRAERDRIGALGDRLGAVRDHDVLIDYVKDYAKKRLRTPLEELPGLAALERYLGTERARCFAPMVKRVNRGLEQGALRESFARWALGLPAAPAAAISVSTVARVLLQARLEELELGAAALEPGAHPEALHELRKSLRRLRYTLENFTVCFERPVNPYHEFIVALQDLLGEMQDRTILTETTARAFGDNLPADVVTFNLHSTRRASYLLGQVRHKWRVAADTSLWQELGEMV